jgi:hypothetical protein
MLQRLSLVLLMAWFLAIGSCNKQPAAPVTPPPVDPGNPTLSYGDSVFFQKNQSDDYVITPNNTLKGRYISFPDGLVIDGNSGAVNISES